MKITLLITEDGSQVTLTPETEVEERILDALHLEPLDIAIRRAGQFGLTQGGYFREFDNSPRIESTMLVLTKSRRVEKTEAEGGATSD